MDLAAHYNQLFTNSAETISNNNYVIDPKIDAENDNRFGITLLIRPSESIKNKIQSFLNELKKEDAEQYYYPNSDMHITVLSIISCHDGFSLSQINPSTYIAVIQENLIHLKNLEINLNGITASNSTIMIQGFPTNESLNSFRDSLRKAFKNTNLEQSIDSRYTLFTAHISVCRFRKPIADTTKLISLLEKYRNEDFGKFEVNKLELVYNDWYQRKEKTQILHQFIVPN
ncbi:mutarotase [Flavobacterium sufflavum]|uniref:Mutarotase n=1 Tax=Flavobacterium sufflavum TaxID=1921138 RepID=A0A3S2UJL9_9FLAO|nr:2'-5' RNA ligase family protein [Flavobacterium sufflavum]RVT76549.1 mutarotase [Flavobacterium sufflavum]